MTNIRTHGFETEAQLQEHLADMDAAETEAATVERPVDLAQMREERALRKLREEVESLRRQLALVREEASSLARNSVARVERDAHRQLGSYPWIKLAGATAGSFVAGRLLRRLPFGAVLAAALPFVTAQVAKRGK